MDREITRSSGMVKFAHAFRLSVLVGVSMFAAAGAYTGTSLAYVGDLSVVVTIKNGQIKSVRITNHQDKQYFSALTDTPLQIIKKQGLKGIDATTGATITSQAIIDATAKALAGGGN